MTAFYHSSYTVPNATTCSRIPLGNETLRGSFGYPWYHTERASLIEGVSDYSLALAAPVIAFWSYSLFFHYLDTRDWKWLEKYKLHESAEVQSRNLVTKRQVIWAVVLQHLIQTILGIFWMSGGPTSVGVDHYAASLKIGRRILGAFGEREDVAYWVYWWGLPTAQFFCAIFFLDTWQYFLHRLMHVNKYLYKAFHSVHHRLHVPYAFGALYNHPVEGFVLDSMGTALAEALCGMTTRQAAFLFTIATFKTVDDHCGYKLPLDPFQMFVTNTADYHDIHHQAVGIKSNFSQPFFVHWDVLLGTRMTREDVARRKLQGHVKTH